MQNYSQFIFINSIVLNIKRLYLYRDLDVSKNHRIMKTVKDTIIINNPNPQTIEFIKMIQRKKDEIRENIRSKKEIYFPKN